MSDVFGVVLAAFQAFRDLGKPFCDIARDFGGATSGIQIEGLFPDLAETGANVRIAQILHEDAEALAIRKLRVVFTLAGEVCVKLDAVANVADQDEWRPAVASGEGTRVFGCLLIGVEHQCIPGPVGGALTLWLGIWDEKIRLAGRFEFQFLLAAFLAALLGFEDKSVFLVEVDTT